MNCPMKRGPAAAMLGILALSTGLLSWSGRVIAAGAQNAGRNAPPVVKITAPRNDSAHPWNSLVSYDVVVTYDGKSTQYQEIPSSEVLLRTTYVPDFSPVAGKPAPAAVPAPAGVLDIVDSNCLGCHDFKAKAMGPSFAAVAARYPNTQATLDTLSKHIRAGSTGVWGQGNMPPHPDLTEGQLHAIVLWIMKDAANPNVNYYVGTEGAFRMQAVGAPGSKGGLILTASYTAPARGGNPEQAAHGEDTVIVHGR